MSSQPPSSPEDLFKLQQDWRELIIAELNRVRQDIKEVQVLVGSVTTSIHQIDISFAKMDLASLRKDVDQLIAAVNILQTFQTRATTLGVIAWALAGLAITIMGWYVKGIIAR